MNGSPSPSRFASHSNAHWLAWTGVAASGFVALRLLHPWPDHLGGFLVAYAVAWVACWATATTRINARTLLLGALVWRTLFVGLPPTLSDDIYRYVWEGQIQWHGWNPFRYAPTAPELLALRNDIWPLINNPSASAIYPPATQLIFKLLATIGGVTWFKAVFCMVDLAIIAVLARGLRQRQRPVGILAWYAWNPLVVVEVAGSGHFEPLALLPLVISIFYLRQRANVAWIALLGSISLKYAGGLLVLPFLRTRRPTWPALGVAAAVLIATTLPYLDAGRHLFDSLVLYTDKWRYNDMLFGLLAAWLGSLTAAKLLAAVLLLTLTLAVSLQATQRRLSLSTQCAVILAGLLFLSPTIHPWYLLWIAVLLPWIGSRALFAWTGSIAFSYLFLFPLGDQPPFDKGSLLIRGLQLLPVGIGAWLDLRARHFGGMKQPSPLVTEVSGSSSRTTDGQVCARIVLMMPALNEAEPLPLVLADLQQLQEEFGQRQGKPLLDEVVVIDNGSTDRTREIAREAGATVLEQPERGYGAACLRGLEYLQDNPPDVVVFMDADHSDDASQLPELLRPLLEDNYDMVIGSRALGEHEPGALLPQARFGNWLATSLIRWRFGFRYTDLGPFRAIRFAALQQIGMADRDFGWTVEMQVRALQENLRVCEVPVRYRKRLGQSKISGTIGGSVRAGVKILATLWKLR
jgi:hypothetical protein